MPQNGRYAQRGVSTGKEDVHQAVKHLDKGLFPQAFCKILPDHLTGRTDRAVVLHADGAGTKSILAYLWWKESGDASVFQGIAQDAAVMNIDDMICTGVTGDIMLSSTIGRNKALVDGAVISEIIGGFHAFADNLAEHGVTLVIGGGETADLGDLVRTVVVDATCCAALPTAEVIDNSRIQAGDVMVGLSSTGKTTYEQAENSGIGSNGLTSARHEILKKAYQEKYPEACAPQTPDALAYCGPYALTDPLPGAGMTIGEALLSPTRTYAPVIQAILREGRHLINGIVHNTGGAHTKCLHFGGDLRYVKDNLFPVPPLFQQIQSCSGTTLREMHEVFNMGCRMELYTNEEGAAMIQSICRRFQLESRIIGRVEKGEGGKSLVIQAGGETMAWEKS